MPTAEEAQLAFEIAKIDLMVAQAQERFGDPRIEMFDVAAIADAARRFGVTQFHAYQRAKSLGLLSWQAADAGGGEVPQCILDQAEEIAARLKPKPDALSPVPHRSQAEV